MMLIVCIMQINILNRNSKSIRAYNYTYEQIKQYVNINPNQLYLFPIGAFSRYTDTVDLLTKGEPSNILHTGGWASQAPITKEKLKNFKIYNIPEDFVKEEVFLLYWSGYSVEFVSKDFSDNLNKNVICNLIDEFETQDGIINVYKIEYE